MALDEQCIRLVLGHMTSTMGLTTRVMGLVTSGNIIKLPNGPRDCHGLLYPCTRTPGVQQGMGCVYPTLAIPVPPAGGWRVGGGSAHSNSARPDVNKQCQALLINVVSIHHHCPSSFVMTTGKVFFIYSLFYCY